VHVLQRGEAVPGGNIALIARLHRLGEHCSTRRRPLHRSADRAVTRILPHAPSASSSSCADLTPRPFGRVDVERVISGRLLLVHTFNAHAPCAAVSSIEDPDAPPSSACRALRAGVPVAWRRSSLRRGLRRRMGKPPLRSVATAGIRWREIAPKILPALTAGSFMRAFNAKEPLEANGRTHARKVILNAEAGLLGAAV